ncbi:MAG: hypothetical protein HY791_31425 [Deltaproteobacteria bacterium]|nr:hypothetical protein [Deltaproteobacteria bacterium]
MPALELVLDFLPADPAVSAPVDPWVRDIARRLREDVPAPPSVMPFENDTAFRPPSSHRAFYLWPGLIDPTHRPVVSLKGMECLAADFPALLRHLRRPSYSPHNQLEHLVFEENKVPGCLTLEEARVGASRAAELQAAHATEFGEVARLPTPIAVFRHTEAAETAVLSELRIMLSRPALDRVTPLVRSGLGVYAYGYSCPPLRVRDVEYLLRGRSFWTRAEDLSSLLDVELVLGRWMSLLARMLWLGFLPATLGSLRTGTICQPQNVCVDGGFVDLDSVVRVEELPDDASVELGLELTLDGMRETVESLVLGRPAKGGRGHSEAHEVSRFVSAQLRAAIEREARPGLTLDARLVRFFDTPKSLSELTQRLATHQQAPSPAFDFATRKFAPLGSKLFAAARG